MEQGSALSLFLSLVLAKAQAAVILDSAFLIHVKLNVLLPNLEMFSWSFDLTVISRRRDQQYFFHAIK